MCWRKSVKRPKGNNTNKQFLISVVKTKPKQNKNISNTIYTEEYILIYISSNIIKVHFYLCLVDFYLIIYTHPSSECDHENSFEINHDNKNTRFKASVDHDK